MQKIDTDAILNYTMFFVVSQIFCGNFHGEFCVTNA